MKRTWPELSYAEAKETYTTVLLWTQIVGKIKMVNLPWINHAWHVTLLVTPTGLTTAAIPHQNQHFQIDFNFKSHHLIISCFSGKSRQFSLQNISVAAFYHLTFKFLAELDIHVQINAIPNELEKVIAFPDDTVHATYQTESVERLHQALLLSQDVLTRFRAQFIGKCSPVHFFWGGFDLAVSRFSGRRAPQHPGGVPHLPDWVAQEAYSHEVCSCGFWPGNEAYPEAAYYAYIYPEPTGLSEAAITPAAAYYNSTLREFILPYKAVQQAKDPEQTLHSFLQSTYVAAATLAKWDRDALEVLPAKK